MRLTVERAGDLDAVGAATYVADDLATTNGGAHLRRRRFEHAGRGGDDDTFGTGQRSA